VNKSEDKIKRSKITRFILSRLFSPDKLETTLGDFEEGYVFVASEKGKIRASLWYLMQILNIVIGKLFNSFYWSIPMYKNYLKIILRNFRKYKGFSFINLAGFTIGLTAFILIFLYIRHELSYDRFHNNADTIYRIITKRKGVFRRGTDMYNTTPPILAPILKADFPEINDVVRVTRSGDIVSYNDKTYNVNGVFYVDPDFFDMFTFPLVRGDKKTALNDPFSVLLTETMSEKFFGDEDPVGKVLKIGNTYDYKITGVLKDTPDNSHLKFDFLLSYETFIKTYNDGLSINAWGNFFGNSTYVRFRDNYNIEEFKEKLPEFSKNYLTGIFGQEEREFYITPMTGIHLSGKINGEFEPKGDMKYIYIFSAVALFVLLIACFNYINLSTAQSIKRAREVGLRKVVGANRNNIINQFLGESFFITVAAMIFSVILVELLLPIFNSLTGRELAFKLFSDYKLIVFLVSITIAGAFLSGCYPAFYLSSFQPVRILKGLSLSTTDKNITLRNLLVILQFIISIIMIISTVVVYRQMNFIRNQNLGFQKEHIINISLAEEYDKSYITFKNELLTYHGIEDGTISHRPISAPGFAVVNWEGKEGDNLVKISLANVDYNFIDFYGIQITEGRKFSKKMQTDSAAFILNETAVKSFGIKDPIGKKFRAWSFEGTIIGIMKDYHFTSMHLQIPPLALNPTINPSGTFSLKVNTGSSGLKEVLSFIEGRYKQFFPGYPFEFSFLDDEVDNMYRTEKRLGTVFNYFTFIAIFITCLGLYGLVLFIAEQRTREIGIRKVLGASEKGIVLLLSKDFIKNIFIASAVSFPLGWGIMNKWLSNFAYRISIGIETFVLALLITVIIAFISTGYRSLKAAAANPVESIKYE